MVGYDPTKEGTKLTTYDHLKSGAIGGMITRALICPIDVVKIRLQLQAHGKGISPKYTSIRHTIRLIHAEEGVRAFWKGHIPAQCLSITFGAVQFSTFEKLTEILHNVYPHSQEDTFMRASSHLVCGGIGSAAASIVSQPVDVLRTRFAAQKEPRMFKTPLQATKHMYAQEGWRSFYRGLIPALSQIVPYSALQFGCYSFSQSMWKKAELPEGSMENLLCGGISGIFSKTIVYPLDVVKKRLQVQGFGAATVSEVTEYNGLFHCLRTVVHVEGYLALYKGFSAAVLKSCATSGLVFFTYELLNDMSAKVKDRS